MKRPFYLLDTNIISEIMRYSPNAEVLNKVREYEGLCAISATTWTELMYGVNVMPECKKKELLFECLIDDIQTNFSIIPYDNHAAMIHADIRSRLKAKGCQIDFQDSQIASIAVSNCMILVTRNTKHFEPIQEVSSLLMESWF